MLRRHTPMLRCPAFRYRDELALVRHLVDALEWRLAGRHETRFLRIIPSDHCHLGVLGPRDPLVEQPEPLDLIADENLGEATVAPSSRPSHGHGPAEAPVEESPEDVEESAPGEIEQIAAEQGGGVRDSTRRPPSSLGFEIVTLPEAEGIELTVTIRFAIYTQHFPTFEEQVRALGSGETDTHTDDTPASHAPRIRQRVSLLEAFVRRMVEVPPIHVRINPTGGDQRMVDNGIVQRAIDTVLDTAVAEPGIWQGLSGDPTVPAQALSSPETFQQYLQTVATGAPVRPPLRARLDIRVHPSPSGHVRIRCYLCNETPRDPVHRYRD
jgi:hypothetical protein